MNTHIPRGFVTFVAAMIAIVWTLGAAGDLPSHGTGDGDPALAPGEEDLVAWATALADQLKIAPETHHTSYSRDAFSDWANPAAARRPQPHHRTRRTTPGMRQIEWTDRTWDEFPEVATDG